MSNTIKRKSKPRILGRKELAQGGFTPYLEKEITDLNGEKVLILHRPVANRTIKMMMNLDTNNEGSMYDAMVEVMADHLVDENGDLIYKSAEEAGEVPIELIPEIVQAIAGSMVNVPGATASRERVANAVSGAMEDLEKIKAKADDAPLATTESESAKITATD